MVQYIELKPYHPPAEDSERSRNHNRGRIPTLSFVLTALSMISIVGCITVIYTANGKPVDGFMSFAPVIRPTVLLSLLSNISSIIRKYLFAEGIAVVWWRAINDGASLADLHFLWSQGKASGFKDTMKYFFRHRPKTYWLIAVFIFMNGVSIADGPLLQQAIRPVTRNLTTNYLEPDMGRNKIIEDGWTGTIDNAAPARLLGTPQLAQVLQQWYKSIPMPNPRCEDGTCSGSIVAAGISTKDVQSEGHWVDLTAPEHQNTTVFSIDFNRSVDNSTGNPLLLMKHSYSCANADGNAFIVSETRTFQAATVKYDVYSDGSNMHLNDTRWPQVLKEESSKGDLPGDNNTPAGPLAGLEYFGYYYLRSLAHSDGVADDGSIVYEPSVGLFVNLFEVIDANPGANVSCIPMYQNATESLTWFLHDVMFRMAWASTNHTMASDYPTWTKTKSVIVYEINLFTAWLAFALMLVCLFTIVSLFWGFWDLDRKVSLSPLETGRALAATLLAPPVNTTSMELEEILKVMGKRKAKII